MGHIRSLLFIFQRECQLAVARFLSVDPAVTVSFFHNELYRLVDLYVAVGSGKRNEDRTSPYCDRPVCGDHGKDSFIFYLIMVKEKANGA